MYSGGMGQLNLYARPRDAALWEWARQHAEQTGGSLSRIVADALRDYRTRIEDAIEKDGTER